MTDNTEMQWFVTIYRLYDVMFDNIRCTKKNPQLARCKRLGGVTSAKMVRNIWKFLFSPDIQKLLNWSGQNDKIRIENSKLFSLVEGL